MLFGPFFWEGRGHVVGSIFWSTLLERWVNLSTLNSDTNFWVVGLRKNAQIVPISAIWTFFFGGGEGIGGC